MQTYFVSACNTLPGVEKNPHWLPIILEWEVGKANQLRMIPRQGLVNGLRHQPHQGRGQGDGHGVPITVAGDLESEGEALE